VRWYHQLPETQATGFEALLSGLFGNGGDDKEPERHCINNCEYRADLDLWARVFSFLAENYNLSDSSADLTPTHGHVYTGTSDADCRRYNGKCGELPGEVELRCLGGGYDCKADDECGESQRCLHESGAVPANTFDEMLGGAMDWLFGESDDDSVADVEVYTCTATCDDDGDCERGSCLVESDFGDFFGSLFVIKILFHFLMLWYVCV
jgi:hypothetical protein